jgi:hypothetical protein
LSGIKRQRAEKRNFRVTEVGPFGLKKIAVKRILQTAAALLAFPALTKASAFT